jgi:hypothetical protein
MLTPKIETKRNSFSTISRHAKTMYFNVTRGTSLPTPDAENALRKNDNVHIVDFVKTVRIRLVVCNSIKLILLSCRLPVLHVKKMNWKKILNVTNVARVV